MQHQDPSDDHDRTLVHDNMPRMGEGRTEAGADDVVPIAEETLQVETREAVTGKVRVHVLTDAVEEWARADLKSEAVEVTRVSVDRIVETIPAVRTENDVVIVPVLEEVLVVEKRLLLKEELHIRRRIETEMIEAPVQLRKQRAVVERIDSDTNLTSDEETSQ